jgi:hypothetical protein
MGTTTELQREANVTEADLERVFLNLTSEASYPQSGTDTKSL